jgi:hypothetical protein
LLKFFTISGILNSWFSNQVTLFAISIQTQFASHEKKDQYEIQSTYSSHSQIFITFQYKSEIQTSVYVFSLKCEVQVLSITNQVQVFSYSSKAIDRIFQSIISQILFNPNLESVYFISNSDNQPVSESIAKLLLTKLHVKVVLNLISIVSILLSQSLSKYFNSTAFKSSPAKTQFWNNPNKIKNINIFMVKYV